MQISRCIKLTAVFIFFLIGVSAQAQTFTVRVEAWQGTQHYYGDAAFAQVDGPSVDFLTGTSTNANWEWEFIFQGYPEPTAKADPYYNWIRTGVVYSGGTDYELTEDDIWWSGSETIPHSIP